MAPGRKRGAKGAKRRNELSLGDLVLAKVKGFPPWPAKISRPEDWDKVPDPKKYFVQFFGTEEIAFIAPGDVQVFTSEAKNKLSSQSTSKKVRFFAQAVKEICELYEKLQNEYSSGTGEDNSEQIFTSPKLKNTVENEALEVIEKVGFKGQGTHCEGEMNGIGDHRSGSEQVSLRPGEMECLDTKPYLLGSPSNLRSGSAAGKGKKRLVERTHSEDIKNVADIEMNSNEQSHVTRRKKTKTEHGCENKSSRRSPANISKFTETRNDAKMIRENKNVGSKSACAVNRKTGDVESAQSHPCFTVQKPMSESKYPTDEDYLPPTKRHHRALEVVPGSAMVSEITFSGSVSRKTESMLHPSKARSPGPSLPAKRRAVRLCDDDEDELPKTPVHGGFTSKVPIPPRAPESKKRNLVHGENYLRDRMPSKSTGVIRDQVKEQVPYSRVFNKASLPSSGLEKMNEELLNKASSPGSTHLDNGKVSSMKAKQILDTLEKSPRGTKDSVEQRNINVNRLSDSISQKKGATVVPTSASDLLSSSSYEMIKEISNPVPSGEKRNTSLNSDTRVHHSYSVVGFIDEKSASFGGRPDVKDDETGFSSDSKNPESAVSMKNLIAAAQARKKQTSLQSSYGMRFPFAVNDSELHRRITNSTPTTLASISSGAQQLNIPTLHSVSPAAEFRHFQSNNQLDNEELEEMRVSSSHQAIESSLSGSTEVAVVRDALEGMIETLSRTKDSIGRATRLAIDCAKHGIANEVVELLIQKLENEPRLHRRVDLFFLVDSITQCSHSQKGIAGASYIPAVQAALSRLIGAAAPSGAGAEENRRQCHKVLRLWLERKILPESVLRRHMDDIGVANDGAAISLSLSRPSRAERAIDDPLREMEGMLVDEYGSNATFQLPGLLSSRVFEEEEDEDSDYSEANFSKERAVTPAMEFTPAIADPENCSLTQIDRRHCILEDVDGELEMEDVSGHLKEEKPSSFGSELDVSLKPDSGGILTPPSFTRNKVTEWLSSPESSPPLPPGSPPVTPSLPTSPPPSPPYLPSPPVSPSLPPPQPLLEQHLFPHSRVGHHPPLLYHQSLHSQPASLSQHVPSLQSTASSSPVLVYQPPPLLHEISSAPMGNQPAPVNSCTRSFHVDSVRSEAIPQQQSFYPPAGVGKAQEHISYNPSKTLEYGRGDAYVNQASQHRQTGSSSFSHRPFHLAYTKASVQQHQFSPFSLPNSTEGMWRYAADEQLHLQSKEFNTDCTQVGWETAKRSCSGYFGAPLERPALNAVTFQPPASNAVAASSQISSHGASVKPAVNWRPT